MGYFSAGLFMSFQYVEHLLGASDEAVEGHRQFSIEDDVFLHRDPCRSGRLQYQREITEQVRNTAVNTDGRTTREFRGGIWELRNSGGNFVALPRDSCRPARPYLRPILVRLNVLSTLLGGTDITRWWRPPRGTTGHAPVASRPDVGRSPRLQQELRRSGARARPRSLGVRADASGFLLPA
jgi:hypothetical protein